MSGGGAGRAALAKGAQARRSRPPVYRFHDVRAATQPAAGARAGKRGLAGAGVLSRYEDRVVFADLNFKINVLWVSLENRPGLMSELVAALRIKVPEFHLVGHNPNLGI